MTASAVALTVLAFLDDGVPTADVELNDGGVWLTNESLLMTGHLNHEAALLDGAFRTTTAQFDVLQEGDTTLVWDVANATLAAVDPAVLTAVTTTAMQGGSVAGLGAGTLGVLDTDDGRLWVLPVAMLGSIDFDAAAPLAELGADAALAVAPNGTVAAVSSATGEWVIAGIDAAGAPSVRSSGAVQVDDASELSVTVVGSDAVIYDAGSGQLHLPGGSVDGPADAVLQQPSRAASVVALSTPDAWWLQPLNGDDAVVTEVGSEGDAAAPVSLNGCVYAAWAGNGEFRRDCSGEEFDVAVAIDGALPSARFTFRVNREVVVLNDVVNGPGWLATEGMERVDNWDALLPPPEQDQDVQDFEEEEELNSLPDRTAENTPPVAEDDTFGVRAGRTTVLPVIDNDYDLDGDVLVGAPVDAELVPGEVQVIRDGGALQVVTSPDASGTASFTYRVADGRGGFDDAKVSLRIAAEGTNTAPEARRQSRISLEQGATFSYNVIPDWADPEGDLVFLEDASSTGPLTVRFTPDGVVTVTADPDATGAYTVDVLVSDGLDSAVGTIAVQVWPTGTQNPQANPDSVTTAVDQPVLVSPIANDMSRSTGSLRLAKIEEVLGVSIVPDFVKGTFTFSATKAGTYYVQYLVTDGAGTAAGLVRIDVLPEIDASLPPIAVSDTALVSPGRATLVDVLANDSDPGGRVLVIQNVDVPPNSGLQVAVLEHRLLSITDLAGLEEPVTISYLVSNGTETAKAEVAVLPIDPPETAAPPIAEDDEVTVRVGDVATVHPLDNDSHPNGDTLALQGLADPLVDPAAAEVFVAEDAIRIKAGPNPGSLVATYNVIDEHGQMASAQVRIKIVGLDAANAAPRPLDSTARVLGGGTVRIPITLDGIDPDGDSVTLEGLATSPELGRVTQVGEDWLVYEAYSDSQGTDTFEFEVRDRLGATARGTVIVGVAPVRGFNNAPVAVRDDATVRAGNSISVDVLHNDSDPDSDLLTLLADLEAPDGVAAEIRGDRVVLTADSEGEFAVRYAISDPYGATSTGTIVLTVDNDMEPVAPIARDDRIAASDVNPDGTVDVEVLGNDEDPDGVASALTVTTSELGAVVSGGTITLTVADAARIVTYTVTDRDGLKASAFILVPGTGKQRPRLVEGAGVEADSGVPERIDLDDYIITTNGNPALVTRAEFVRAAHANGESLVIDERTLTYTSADGYYGKDAITVEITDGLTVDDPEGTVATITIPVTVLPAGNVPPTMRDVRMDVTPGEAATELDLARLVTDPNPDDVHTFDITGTVPAGFTAEITGGVLSVAAAARVERGTVIDLELTVTDGLSEPVPAQVRVVVTSSSRSLADAVDDYVTDARPGVEIVVPVTANDYNPFPEVPLTISAWELEAGDATFVVDEGSLRITPGAQFSGTLQIRYGVRDQTGDPDREAQARVYVTVVAPPDAPVKPQVRSVADKTVVLEWTSPATNGAPIDHYTVRSNQGTSMECAATICTITGLSNDVEYTFTVTATNRAGESEPSAPSDVARPDVMPEQPSAPTLTFGDGLLNIAWPAGVSNGSPISSYSLELSPPPLSGPSLVEGLAGTSYTWTGLENGVAYQARVRAHNAAPDPSAWSEYSASEVPAGVPDAPAKPSTSRLAPVGDRAQLAVAWAEPSGNGDTVSSYTVSALRGGTAVATVTVPAGVYSQAFELATDDVAYTFQVIANNKAGASDASPQSDPRRAFVAPGAPTGVTATPGDRQITIAFTPGPRNGADAAWISYEYRLNGTGSYAPLPGNRIIGGLSNGSSYSVDLRATATADGVSYTGAASAPSAAAIPFGVPSAPQPAAWTSGQTANFSWPGATTNGRPIAALQFRINGGGWQAGSITGGSTSASGTGTYTISVRVQDSEGQWSTEKSATTTVSPVATVSKGPEYTGAGCSGTCYYLHWELRYFPANTTLTYECHNSTGAWVTGSTFTTNGSGSYSGNRCWIMDSSLWDPPYWGRVRLPNGTWIESNKDQYW